MHMDVIARIGRTAGKAAAVKSGGDLSGIRDLAIQSAETLTKTAGGPGFLGGLFRGATMRPLSRAPIRGAGLRGGVGEVAGRALGVPMGAAGAYGAGSAFNSHILHPDVASDYAHHQGQYNTMESDYKQQLSKAKEQLAKGDLSTLGAPNWHNFWSKYVSDNPAQQETRARSRITDMESKLQSGDYGGARMPEWMGGGRYLPSGIGPFAVSPTAGWHKEQAGVNASAIKNRRYGTGTPMARWGSEAEFNKHLDAILAANPGVGNPRNGYYGGNGSLDGLSYYGNDYARPARGIDFSHLAQTPRDYVFQGR